MWILIFRHELICAFKQICDVMLKKLMYLFVHLTLDSKNSYLDYSIAEIRSKYVDKQLRSGNMPTTPKSSRTDKRMRPGELKRKRKAALHAIGKLKKFKVTLKRFFPTKREFCCILSTSSDVFVFHTRSNETWAHGILVRRGRSHDWCPRFLPVIVNYNIPWYEGRIEASAWRECLRHQQYCNSIQYGSIHPGREVTV